MPVEARGGATDTWTETGITWNNKPALRQVYHDFYQLILGEIDQSIPGTIVELGAGIGNLKSYLPQALCTDLFANPWIDQISAYRLRQI